MEFVLPLIAVVVAILTRNTASAFTREHHRIRSVSGFSRDDLTHYELAYMAMFAIPIAGALWLRTQLPPWLKFVALAGFCASLFSLLISVYPIVDVVSPLAYAAKIAGTVLISNLVALIFYRLRRR